MGQHNCCNQQKVKRGLWSPEEDETLIRFITSHGYGCWSEVPDKAGLQRCGKSCRLRWINYLRPDIRRGRFTQEEEKLIIRLHDAVGNRWAQIASHLPGRTDNEIKNYWNSWIKKKIRKRNRWQQQLSTTPNGERRTVANTDHYPRHNELLNASLFEGISGTNPLTTTTPDYHQPQEPSLPYPSLKNNFVFETSSMISHSHPTTSMMNNSMTNLDLVWSFINDNQKVPEVVTKPPWPLHPAVRGEYETDLSNNNNYLPALVNVVDNQIGQLEYDQCLEKKQAGYNIHRTDDELSLWDMSQQCPNFLFWDNGVEESVMDEVALAPLPSLMKDCLSPFPSSLP